MRKAMTAMAAVFVFTACDGNPFITELITEPDVVDGQQTTSVVDLPGTENPSADVSIFRYEARDEASGSGYAESISYDAVNDLFFVDNLAFDGDNFYERDVAVPTLGPFQVYENRNPIVDTINSTPIGQFQHKAIYGVSTTGNTEFAIVRTGAYVGYGFGGFLYQRNNTVTLPTTGQAVYSGQYAGIRDFLQRGGLEYVTADVLVAVDFEDFNDGVGVRGQLTNRRVFDSAGLDITSDIIDAINNEGVEEIIDPTTGLGTGQFTPATYASISALPTLVFRVGPGVSDVNGEMTGLLDSQLQLREGALETFETGNYYAIVSGDNAEEIVGVIVVESQDPRFDGVTARETGGFIVYR